MDSVIRKCAYAYGSGICNCKESLSFGKLCLGCGKYTEIAIKGGEKKDDSIESEH